jgi:hypothetical protein
MAGRRHSTIYENQYFLFSVKKIKKQKYCLIMYSEFMYKTALFQVQIGRVELLCILLLLWQK